MNLTQIEKRFQALNLRAGYINYKYNPNTKAIPGLPQHIYKEDLKRAHELDQEVFGKATFDIQDALDVTRTNVNTKSRPSTSQALNKQNNLSRAKSAVSKNASMHSRQKQQSHIGTIVTNQNDPLYDEKSSINRQQQNRTQSSARPGLKNLFNQCRHVPSAAELKTAQENKLNEIPWHKKHLQHSKTTRPVQNKEEKRPNENEIQNQASKGVAQLSRIKIPQEILLALTVIHTLSQRDHPQQTQVKQVRDPDQSLLLQAQSKQEAKSPEPKTMIDRGLDVGSDNTMTPVDHSYLKSRPPLQIVQDLEQIEEPQITKLHAQTNKAVDGILFSNKTLDETRIFHAYKTISETATPIHKSEITKSQLLSEPQIVNQGPTNANYINTAYQTDQTTDGELRFNVKVTDLNLIENPFVILENLKVDDDGFVDLSQLKNEGFAWLQDSHSVQQRTFKVEVTYKGQLLLLRFIHFGKHYPLEYSKIALRISNNMIQTNLLRLQTLGKNNSSHPSMLQSHLSGRFYSTEPQRNIIVELLEQLDTFKLHQRNLAAVLRHFQLIRFPEMMKNLRVLIEYQDCILQARDLVSYQIIQDDNFDRLKQTLKLRASMQEEQERVEVKGREIQPSKQSDIHGLTLEVVKNQEKFGAQHKGYIKQLNKSQAARTLVLRNNNAKANAARDQNQTAANRIPTIQTHQKQFQDLLMATKMQPVNLSDVMKKQELASLKSHDMNQSQFEQAERSLGYEGPNNNSLHKYTNRLVNRFSLQESPVNRVNIEDLNSTINIPSATQTLTNSIQDYSNNQRREVSSSKIMKNNFTSPMPDILECKSVSAKSTLSGNSPQRDSDLLALYREAGRRSGLMHNKSPENSKIQHKVFQGTQTLKEEQNNYEQRMTDLQKQIAQQHIGQIHSGEISQILSPAKSFLYRGSSARRTVANMLNARDVTDPTLIFTLFTSPPITF